VWSFIGSESSSTLITSEKNSFVKNISKKYCIEVELHPMLIAIRMNEVHPGFLIGNDIRKLFRGLIITR
jgi:hypothetical protein